MKMMVGVTAVYVKMNLVMMVVTKMVIVVIARSLKIALMIVMMEEIMANVQMELLMIALVMVTVALNPGLGMVILTVRIQTTMVVI